MLKLEAISYQRNGKEIIKNVSMQFEDGKTYGIVGNNGVGKSTLGYIIMGLSDYSPKTGTITLDGEDITKLSITDRAKKGITLSWQEPARFEGLTIKQYLSIGNPTMDDIRSALITVNLDPDKYLGRFVDKKLSGGERKKVELASCLLLKPKYVILDEPDSGIDIMSLDMIINLIKTFKDSGTTVIVITHRKEIARICDYSYLVCGGKVLLEGDSNKIIKYYEEVCDACDHINYPEENGERS